MYKATTMQPPRHSGGHIKLPPLFFSQTWTKKQSETNPFFGQHSSHNSYTGQGAADHTLPKEVDASGANVPQNSKLSPQRIISRAVWVTWDNNNNNNNFQGAFWVGTIQRFAKVPLIELHMIPNHWTKVFEPKDWDPAAFGSKLGFGRNPKMFQKDTATHERSIKLKYMDVS